MLSRGAGRGTGGHLRQGGGMLCAFSTEKRPRDFGSFSSSWCREETPLELEVSFGDLNSPYEMVTSTWFSMLFCVCCFPQ